MSSTFVRIALQLLPASDRPRFDDFLRRWSGRFLVLAVVAALTALFGWVGVAYRGVFVWPTFAGGFTATALGVLLALYLERERSSEKIADPKLASRFRRSLPS